VRLGDRVDAAGEGTRGPAVRVHAADEASAARAVDALSDAVRTGDGAIAPVPLIHRRIGFDGAQGAA